MSELTSTLTRKGQVTIPVRIRRQLGLQEGDSVSFEVVGDDVRIVRQSPVTDRTAGALAVYARPGMSTEQERAAAERAIAADRAEV